MPITKQISLQTALAKRLQRFRERFRRLQNAAGTTNVHQFRIACRELLACHPLLKGMAPGWKSVVKSALDSLDALRDLQQMRDWLLHEQLMTPALIASTFAKSLRKAESRWEQIVPDLCAPDFNLTLSRLESALLADEDAAEHLQTVWKMQWEKSLRRVRKCLQTAVIENPDSLHRLRIRYKRLRYLLELQLDSGALPTIRKSSLKRWQDEFGRAGDFRVMAHYAEKLQLQGSLQQQFRRQADEHASRCVHKREAFATFLLELERQVGSERG